MNTQTSANLPRNKHWQDRWFGLDRNHPETEHMMDVAQAFIVDFNRCDRNRTLLVLSGRNGCGKTAVARRIAQWARCAGAQLCLEFRMWSKIPSDQFVAWSEICDIQRNERQGIWHDCEEADLLVIDDVGSETDRYRSGDATRNLADMLNAREKKHTVITTNIHPDSWREQWDSRVADRLLRRSRIVEIHNAPSYWLEKQRTPTQ